MTRTLYYWEKITQRPNETFSFHFCTSPVNQFSHSLFLFKICLIFAVLLSAQDQVAVCGENGI